MAIRSRVCQVVHWLQRAARWHPIHGGFRSSEDFRHMLIFWNQHQAFGSELRLHESMAPIQFERMVGGRASCPPTCSTRPSMYGGPAVYSLGIEVRDWYWVKIKGSCAAPLHVDLDHQTGSCVPYAGNASIGGIQLLLGARQRSLLARNISSRPGHLMTSSHPWQEVRCFRGGQPRSIIT